MGYIGSNKNYFGGLFTMSDLKKEFQSIIHPEERDSLPGFTKMEEVALSRLHPPEPRYGDIDFTAIANSSEFKRFVYFIYTGKVHRGTLQQLDREIKQTQEAVEIIKEYARGSKADYRAVMKELKERLKEVKQNG